MTNLYFQQKIASDELKDTIFFSSGLRSDKQKTVGFSILTLGDKLKVRIGSFKSIDVNGFRCKSVYHAKLEIMRILL